MRHKRRRNPNDAVRGKYSNEREKVLVGGVNSPVRAFRAVGGEPLIIENAEAARVFGTRMGTNTRLRLLVGRADSGPRASGGGGGDCGAGGARNELWHDHGAGIGTGDADHAAVPFLEKVRFV